MPERQIDRSFSLSGRSAIVTGASRGIGAAIAEALSEAGAYVIGLSRTIGAAKLSTRVDFRVCDLSDQSRLRALFESEVKNLDILVNAAGISVPTDIEPNFESEIERFRRTIEANLTIPYFLTLAATPLLRLSKAASVINLTSINSRLGFPRNPGYVAAKAGLAGLTRALAVDLAKNGIRVNAIAPGYIRTAMTADSFADPVLNEQRRRHTLLNRWGVPDDVGMVAVFLASDASAYMTGQELFVDGGWTVNGLFPSNSREEM